MLRQGEVEVGGARERWPSQQCQNSTGGEVRQRAAAEREREKIVKAEAFAGKVCPRKPTNMRARIDGREARCIELSLSSILRAGLRTKGMRLSRYVFLGAPIKRQPLYGRGRALARCVGGVRLIYSRYSVWPDTERSREVSQRPAIESRSYLTTSSGSQSPTTPTRSSNVRDRRARQMREARR